MNESLLLSLVAVGLTAIGFFYTIGRDTRGGPDGEESKLDQIFRSTEIMNRKLDEIAQWQRQAAEIHAAHEERIKTLFCRVTELERRMEDRKSILDALQTLLERTGPS